MKQLKLNLVKKLVLKTLSLLISVRGQVQTQTYLSLCRLSRLASLGKIIPYFILEIWDYYISASGKDIKKLMKLGLQLC